MAKGVGGCGTAAAARTTGTRPKPKSYREAMALGERIPEGQSGPWRIERFTVGEEDAKWSAFEDRGRGVRPGTYTRLVRERGWGPMMSDTPAEMRDHAETYFKASKLGGRWLIHGLGIGMITQALLSLDNVEHIDCVEIDQDIINLVAPAFQEEIDAGRLTIHHGDAFTKEWPKGMRWAGVYSDIWPDLCTDNLAEMGTLKRKFARRCDFHGCWGQELLCSQRDRERRSGFGW